jgi:hypothetical protein
MHEHDMIVAALEVLAAFWCGIRLNAESDEVPSWAF